jgi:hypothetical protein
MKFSVTFVGVLFRSEDEIEGHATRVMSFIQPVPELPLRDHGYSYK